MSAPAAAHPSTLYRYVEVADGGVDHRGRVKLLEQVDGFGKTDQYITYGRCDIGLLTWLNTHKNKDDRPTTAGFTGEIWTDRFHLDLDAKDLEKALVWARTIYQRLINWSVPVDAPRIYYSGSKGFHIEVPAACFGGFLPSSELHRSLKAAATLILQDITFDPSVYNKLRLWRLENTLNSKGRFKIRLTPGELLALNLGQIQALALAVREYPEPDIDIEDWLPVPELVDIWRHAQEEANKPASSGPAAALGDDERDRITTAAIGASWPRTDEQGARPVRHDYLLAIGGYLARRTNAEHVAALLKAGATASGDDERDWGDEIDRIAASSAEKVAAGTPVVGLPRLAEQFPGLAKAIGALWADDGDDTLDDWPGIEVGPDGQVVELPRRPMTRSAPGWKASDPSGGSGRVNGSTEGPKTTEPGQTSTVSPWPLPDRLDTVRPAPPLDLHLLPVEIARTAEDTAERLQCPVDFSVFPTIAALAALAGREAGIRPRSKDDWVERLAFWIVCVAPPSQMKTPALKDAMRPVYRQHSTNLQAFAERMTRWRAECDEIKKIPKEKRPELPPAPRMSRITTSDATVEKLAMLLGGLVEGKGGGSGEDDDNEVQARGLVLHRDELAGLLRDWNKYSDKGGDREFYLSAYTGGQVIVDRVTRPSIIVADLLFSIVGGIQPRVARELLGSGPDDGLKERCTMIWPEMSREWKQVDRYPSQAARAALDRVSDALSTTNWPNVLWTDQFERTPYCRFSPEGQAIWDAWHGKLMRDIRRAPETNMMLARVGKYPGLAARLMLLFHLVEWASGRQEVAKEVSAVVVENVLTLINTYMIPMDLRVHGGFAITAEAEGGRRIAEWITKTRPASFTGREIRRHEWTRLQDQKAVSAALEWLAAHRWIKEYEPKPGLIGGRPSSIYIVNPRLAELQQAGSE